MAVAFTNIFVARIEYQIQSCIEPYSGHQRIFVVCSGMFWSRLQIFGQTQKSLEVKLREKKFFASVTIMKTLLNQKPCRDIELLFWKR